MLSRILNIVLVASALLSSNVLYAQEKIISSNETYEEALQSWDLVLDKYVDDSGRTDFVALAGDTDDLRRFVDFVGLTSPASHPARFETPEKFLPITSTPTTPWRWWVLSTREYPKTSTASSNERGFLNFAA